MMKTIQDNLKEISRRLEAVSGTPLLDAQVLIAHLLGKKRAWVMAHPEISLDSHQQDAIARAIERLEIGEPLPYLIGHWEFYGLDFYLTPRVLIPRPETELLVERGIEWLRSHSNARASVDVGTGSGCIGIALAHHIPDLRVLMTDISYDALDVARENAQRMSLLQQIEFLQADLLAGVDGTFDLICGNLPYIPTRVLSGLDVSKREPRIALDGGESGIVLIARLLVQSKDHLAPGGLVLLEIEASQGQQVRALATSLFPGSDVTLLKDLSGRDRCVQIERHRLIAHICQAAEWLAAQNQGIFTNQSLASEGYIHCSTTEQILQTANRFFLGVSGLNILWIKPDQLSSEVRWEQADGTCFPHIYGPVELHSIVNVTSLNADDDGIFRRLIVPD